MRGLNAEGPRNSFNELFRGPSLCVGLTGCACFLLEGAHSPKERVLPYGSRFKLESSSFTSVRP